MNNQTTRKDTVMNSTLFVKRFDPTVTTDVVEDMTLPDYLPEVRRIVAVQTNATVDGKYLSGDELEADGGVTYTVLYTTSDGSLAQFSQTTQYTGHIPISNGDESEISHFSAGDIVLSANLDNVNCRVTAPRKLTLSSKVKLSALSQKPQDASLKIEKTSEVSEKTVRRRALDVSTAYMTEIRQTGEVSGEIREREGMKLICANGNLCLNDVRCDNKNSDKNRIVIKGDAYLNALMQTPDGEYVVSRSRAPIDEEILLPDKQTDVNNTKSAAATAFGKVVMIDIEGSGGNFVWKMEYDIDCDITHSIIAEITTDAYLPDSEDILDTAEIKVLSAASAVNGRLTTSATIPMRNGSTFVYAWGTGVPDKSEINSGKMTVSGAVKLNVITVGNGEFYLDDVTIPLKYECEASSEAEKLNAEHLLGRMQVDVTEINARADGNTLNLTAELAITLSMLAETTKSIAVRLTPTENVEKTKKNMIRVYIPDLGESEWDVEKRFRLGHEAVREGNAYVI